MMNRILNDLPPSRRKGKLPQPPQPVAQELHHLAEEQLACRMRQVAMYVQEYPATGISAAFCIGIILGWVIKRW